MSNAEILKKYLDDCELILNNSQVTAEECSYFVHRVCNVLGSDYPEITKGISYYSRTSKTVEGPVKSNISLKDSIENLKCLKDHLEYIISKDPIIQVPQNQFVLSLALENQITVSVVNETKNKIQDLQVAEEIKQMLQDIVNEAESYREKGLKDKIKEKLPQWSKSVLDKGADALIAILPYLGRLAGIFQ